MLILLVAASLFSYTGIVWSMGYMSASFGTRMRKLDASGEGLIPRARARFEGVSVRR